MVKVILFPSEKGYILKGKDLFPMEANPPNGSEFFPFSVETPFQNWTGVQESKQEVA